MNQNLSQYKIFYEVAKAGNISQAAKELYISQPAIQQIHQQTGGQLKHRLILPETPEASS